MDPSIKQQTTDSNSTRGNEVASDHTLHQRSGTESTLNNLAITARRWLAETTLALTFPLAASGFVGTTPSGGQSNASETTQVAEKKEGKFPIIGKLSEVDADLIVKNYRREPGASGGVLAHLAERRYKNTNPTKPERDVDSWSRHTSGKEKIELLQKISLNKEGANSDHVDQTLSIMEAMLSAPLFKKGIEIIREANPECVSPMGELAAVWGKSEDEVERFLHIVSSPGFKEYQRTLHEAININVQDNLDRLVQEYSTRVEGNTFTVGPELAPWVERFRAELPEISIKNIEDATKILMKVMPYPDDGPRVVDNEKFENWLSEYKDVTTLLMKGYGIPSGSLAEAGTSTLKLNEIQLLKRDETKALSDYLRQEHASIELGRDWGIKFVAHRDGFTQSFARPIVELLHTDGPTINMFLAQFGKELSEINLTELHDSTLHHNTSHPKDLVTNPNFSEFLDQEFSLYPGLQQSLTTTQIFQLAAAFDHREEYERLNEHLSVRSVSKVPDLTLKNIDLKEEMLSALKDNGFEAIKVDPNKEFNWGVSDLRAAIDAVKTPEAKEIYKVLRENWKISSMDLQEFSSILSREDKEKLFFLNEENSKTFAEISSRFSLVKSLTDPQLKPPTLESLILYGRVIVDNADLLLRREVANFFERYDERIFKTGSDGTKHVTPYGLSEIIGKDRKYTDNIQQYTEAAQLLEGRYGFPPNRVLDELRPEVDIQQRLQQLKSAEFDAAFRSLNYGFLKEADILRFRRGILESYTPESRLSLTRAIAGNADVAKTVRKALEAGFEPNNANTLSVLINECYDNPSVRSALNDPKFIDLTRQLNQRFFGGTADLRRMREYSELHNELQHIPGAIDWLLSPESEKVAQYLGHNFRVATERPSTLRPLLRVGKDLDLNKLTEVRDVLQNSGEAISSNDIVFLSEISKRPELLNRLTNRTTMVEELGQVYSKAAFPRPHLDQLGSIQKPNDEMEESFRQNLIETRRKIEESYTERPSIEELSSMQLLRVSLINEMLQREDTLTELGNLIAKDIVNKRTELGGTILLNGTSASLRQTESASQRDGNFIDYKYPRFIDGLGTFHLHAMDTAVPEYTGPSGWLGSGSADVGWVDEYNVTDTVFTTMGHPIDAHGEPQTDRLRVNADVYFVDKRDPRNPTLRIIDLGEVIVPFSSK